MKEWLTEAPIPFQRQHRIGSCHVDLFLKPDIVVELQGCHWHDCTACFPDRAGLSAQRLQDAKRLAFFASQGFRILLIWEHEIKGWEKDSKGKARFLRRIRTALKKGSGDAV